MIEILREYGDREAISWFLKDGTRVIKTYREICEDIERDNESFGDNTYDMAISILRALEFDETIVLLTSGTEGRKKEVSLASSSVLLNAKEANERIDDYGSRFIPLPFDHAYGLTCGLVSGLMKGSALYFSQDVKYMMRDMELSKAAGMILVPSLLPVVIRMRREGRLENLKVITCGGAPCDEDRLKEIEELGIEAVLGYGMTECSPLIASNGNTMREHDNAGMPLPSVDVRINSLTSEIEVGGPTVMRGYLNESNVNVFTPDGYLRTGDTGYLKNGRVYITGRIKNLIIMDNGEKIGAEMLERMAADRLGEIKVSFRGGRYIEMIVNDVNVDRKEVEALVREINERLPGYLRIGRITYGL